MPPHFDSVWPSLLSLAGAAPSTIFVVTKLLSRQTHLSWQNTSFVATKVYLLRQNFCHDKIMFVTTKYFLTTNICHDKHMFVMMKVLLWQAYFCQDKRCVLSWQTCVFHNKSKLVMTNLLLSWQNMCFVMTNMCLCLSQQKRYLWQLLPMIAYIIL